MRSANSTNAHALLVEMMREAGAAEVHMRIASPPTTDSCLYAHRIRICLTRQMRL